MLGEKITATIKAKYYFGSPVTKAKVKYKVTADHATATQWYPDRRRGTGSTARATGGSPTTTPGIPAGSDWGCLRPMPFWWPRHDRTPPEVVAEVEVRDRARRHRRSRDRHRARQGTARRPGPQVLDHGRGASTNRAARSSARATCWSPASRSRSSPGSIAATTALGDTIEASFQRPDARSASRSRARAS